MAEERESLGVLALQRANGSIPDALAELGGQSVSLWGFAASRGAPKQAVLAAYDLMSASGRKALIEIMEEDDGAPRT